jgi:hypothetical protein
VMQLEIYEELVEEDTLSVGGSEIEDLENDELSPNEAAFLQGYNALDEEDE